MAGIGREIGRKEVVGIAKRRLANIRGLNLEKSDVLVESHSGRVTFAPTEKTKNIEDLAKGVIVGAVSMEFAPRGALLEDGSYEVKILKDHGTWVAQFIKEEKIVASTIDVKVVETQLDLEEPVAILIGFSPCAVCIFLGGVIVGLVVAALIAK